MTTYKNIFDLIIGYRSGEFKVNEESLSSNAKRHLEEKKVYEELLLTGANEYGLNKVQTAKILQKSLKEIQNQEVDKVIFVEKVIEHFQESLEFICDVIKLKGK